MKRRRFLEALTAALLAVLMIGGNFALAAPPEGKGPNKDDGGGDDGGTTDPVLPPIEYTVHSFAPPYPTVLSRDLRVYDFSNMGTAVGFYATPDGLRRGWLYDPAIDPDFAIDLNEFAVDGVPEGWYIASAIGVNNLGMVVGYVASAPDREERRGFVLDTLSSPPMLSLLPDDVYSHTWARKINDNGDILGVFRRPDDTWGAYAYNPAVDEQLETIDLNLIAGENTGINEALINEDGSVSPAQIVGTTSDLVPFVYTRGQGFDFLESVDTAYASEINDHGVVCGVEIREEEETYRGNKTRIVKNRYLFRDPGTAGEFDETKNDPTKNAVSSINSHGSILTGGGGSTDWKNYVYTDEFGFVDVASLVIHPEPWKLLSTKMNDMAVYGFGELAGVETVDLPDGTTTQMFFVLTPSEITP